MQRVDVSEELTQVAVDAYDHQNFQKSLSAASLTLAAGSLTPCSVICGTGSLVIDGVIVVDEILYSGVGWGVGNAVAPTDSGLMFSQTLSTVGNMAPGKANAIGVTATFVTTHFSSEDNLRE